MSAHWHQSPIMLVENDPNDIFFVRHALEEAKIGNPLLVCSSADDARLELATLRPAIPALFILDIGLSGAESGIDFLRWLREQPSPLGATSAMMLTGSARPEDRAAAATLGSVSFLIKPATETRLTEAVQALGFVVVTSAISGQMGFRIIERR